MRNGGRAAFAARRLVKWAAVCGALVAVLATLASASSAYASTPSPTSRSAAPVTPPDQLPPQPPPPPPHQTARAPYGVGSEKVCGPAAAGTARCNALVATNSSGTPLSSKGPTSGYYPADLQSAYQLPSSTAGTGETVALIEAHNDPDAASDLSVYRSQFGLPACTTSNGCLREVNQTGGTRLPSNNASWAQEISVDVDMVSAVCPNCDILLVEASSSSFSNLATAANEAATLGADVISNSYGGSESSDETSYDPSYDHPGIMVTASSGDSGYGTEYPAASPYVTAVGGTTLTESSGSARGWSETAWSGAGSGCSSYEPKPSWQTDTGCSNRTIADVSADADPNTGVAVYDSDSYQGASGWLVFGGTSVSNVIIASVYAVGGDTSSLDYGSFPYSHTTWLNDVTSGSDGSCGGSYLCTAGPGYDGPTGWGTPDGDVAFGGASAPPTVTGLSPSSGPTSGGTVVSVTGTGFIVGSTFSIDFGSSASRTVSCSSTTSCTATSPAGTGTVDVTVTTAGGTSSSSDEFSYVPAPTVSAINPTSGPVAGGSVVTITGTNFATASGATNIDFGSSASSTVSCSSTTSCTATSPAGTGTVDVTVTTAGGTATSPVQFTYVPAPAPPTDVTATGASPHEIDLTWTGSSGATGYDVFRSTDGTSFSRVASNVTGTSYSDTQYLRMA
ncbi:MAG: IPT/TIG domain-containing protein, partial [Nitrososphaerales archaeon]